MPKYAEIPFGHRFGDFIRFRRNALGLKQITVAERAFGAEVDQHLLSKIELRRRRSIDATTIRALCDVLEITDQELALLQAGYTAAEMLELAEVSARAKSSVEKLPTRSRFFSKAATLIASTETFRALLTGPFFCHPPQYFSAKAGNQYPDTDKLLKTFIARQGNRNHSTRIILSNSERYVAKVNSYIPLQKRKKFYLETLKNIDELFGSDGNRGPDLCCAKLGYIHISYIFDHAALVQHRKSQMTPTEGGDCITAVEVVEMERNRFDMIFDANSSGQRKEVAKLKEFIEKRIREQD